MSEVLSPSAAALTQGVVRSLDRVIVTGAGGWFGRTALDLLAGTGAEVLALASTARTIQIAGRPVHLELWSERVVRDFAPTAVIDCAFLTRDKLSTMPYDEYTEVNRRLTDQLVVTASSPSVRVALTISSGAAVYPVDAQTRPLADNPYGYLKREAEKRLLGLATEDRHVIVARAWSVSGGYVLHPRNYALGDLILQARDGNIRVRAETPVWRRYVGADELLAVALSAGARRSPTVIDSGGELVEVGDLARIIRDVVNPEAQIERPQVIESAGDRYASDGRSWDRAVVETGLVPKSLVEQVKSTARWLT